MKKLLIALALFVVLVSLLVGFKSLFNPQLKQDVKFANLNNEAKGISELYIELPDLDGASFISETEKALESYRELLRGDRNVIYNGRTIDIIKIISSEMEIGRDYNARYAFFDTNGDGLPDLHVRSQSHYYILTCKDDNLIVWAELTPYYEQLNNRAFLHTRPGGTPSHISYIYIIMDFSGNEMLRFYFKKYDIDENGAYDDNDLYFFEDVEVSKKDWDTLTEKYLSIGSDLMQWFNYSNDELAF